MTATNALAYYTTKLISAFKPFIVQTPGFCYNISNLNNKLRAIKVEKKLDSLKFDRRRTLKRFISYPEKIGRKRF